MNVINKPQSVLLVHSGKKLLPLSTLAFTVSSGKKSKVEQLYLNSIVIFRNGEIKKIDRINFLGFWGKTIWWKLLSFANGGVRSIAIEFLDLPKINFFDIKQMVLSGYQEDRKSTNSFFNKDIPLSKVLSDINISTNCAELFDAIGMPNPDHLLDILC